MKKYPYFVPSSAPPSVWRRVWLTATGCVWLGALCLSAPAQAAADREDGPNPPLLRPLKVVSTSGNVQNAEALVDGHGGYATLTWGGQGPAPMVILGYGRDVGGLPFFEVAGASGTPQLQALYSETQQYLLPGGDAASNSPQDPTVAQPETSFVGDAAGANLARGDPPLEPARPSR